MKAVRHRVFTCTDFPGPYPVGVASVVVAISPESAKIRLSQAVGCSVDDIGEVKEVDTATLQAIVLNDGDY